MGRERKNGIILIPNNPFAIKPTLPLMGQIVLFFIYIMLISTIAIYTQNTILLLYRDNWLLLYVIPIISTITFSLVLSYMQRVAQHTEFLSYMDLLYANTSIFSLISTQYHFFLYVPYHLLSLYPATFTFSLLSLYTIHTPFPLLYRTILLVSSLCHPSYMHILSSIYLISIVLSLICTQHTIHILLSYNLSSLSYIRGKHMSAPLSTIPLFLISSYIRPSSLLYAQSFSLFLYEFSRDKCISLMDLYCYPEIMLYLKVQTHLTLYQLTYLYNF